MRPALTVKSDAIRSSITLSRQQAADIRAGLRLRIREARDADIHDWASDADYRDEITRLHQLITMLEKEFCL